MDSGGGGVTVAMAMQTSRSGHGSYGYGNMQLYGLYDDAEYHGNTTSGGKKKKNKKKYKGEGYDWIRRTLARVDSQYGDEYLANFEKHKVQDDRLGDLLPEDWKELIPAIGPRNDFKRLWRMKHQNQNRKTKYGVAGYMSANIHNGEFDYDDETTTVPDSEMNGSEYTEETHDDIHSELLSEPGSAFSNNFSNSATSNIGYDMNYVTKMGTGMEQKIEEEEEFETETETGTATETTSQFTEKSGYTETKNEDPSMDHDPHPRIEVIQKCS